MAIGHRQLLFRFWRKDNAVRLHRLALAFLFSAANRARTCLPVTARDGGIRSTFSSAACGPWPSRRNP
jgi:hypothetical protein